MKALAVGLFFVLASLWTIFRRDDETVFTKA
jgi:hypothetical protein